MLLKKTCFFLTIVSTTGTFTLHENAIVKVVIFVHLNVQLVCSANGYPIPTFKWFRVVDSGTLNGIDDKLIEYNEERTQAVLSVTASTATFGQRYKCQVSNNLGDAEKHFTVLEIDKPLKPSQVNPFKSTDNQIDLKIMWSGPILFPIDGFEIQYMKQENLKRPGHQPRENDWNKAKLAIVDMDDTLTDEDEELPGIIASITNLDELTVYWVRLRVVNDVGESPWCIPVLVTTLKKSEEVTEPPTEEPVNENEQGQNKTVTAGLTGDSGTFYGIFFAGGIIIVAVVCMFAMRMV